MMTLPPASISSDGVIDRRDFHRARGGIESLNRPRFLRLRANREHDHGCASKNTKQSISFFHSCGVFCTQSQQILARASYGYKLSGPGISLS